MRKGQEERRKAYILEHSNYSEHPYSSLYSPSTPKLQCILYSNEFLLLKYNTFHVDSCQYLLQLLAQWLAYISSHLYGKKLGIKLWRPVDMLPRHLTYDLSLPSIQPETRGKNSRGMLISWQSFSLHCNETLSCYHLCELSFRVWPTWRQIKGALRIEVPSWFMEALSQCCLEGELIHFRSLQGKSQLHWDFTNWQSWFWTLFPFGQTYHMCHNGTVLPGGFWERDPQQAAVLNSTAENSTMLVVS